MRIAIIDSGISFSRKVNIQQYIVGKDIVKEQPIDLKGHGSLMFSIIETVLNEEDIVFSLRVNEKYKIDNFIIAKAIEFCIQNHVKIINISLGITDDQGKQFLQETCLKAYSNNILIIASASNLNEIVYPWACQQIVKVRQGEKSDNSLEIKKDHLNVYNLFVNRRRYGIDHRIALGNSFATAYITSILCQKIKNNEIIDPNDLIGLVDCLQKKSDRKKIELLLEKVHLINGKVEFINSNKINWRRCVVVPFCKEMDGVIQYGVNAEVVAGSGGIQTNIAKKYNVVSTELSDEDVINYNISTIIIGYLDKIEVRNIKYTEEFLVEYAIRNNLNIFSFKRLRQEYERKILEKGSVIYKYAEVINAEKLTKIRAAVPYNFLPHKPVIGVFGTSSRQGKFTCQLKLKKQFEEDGFTVNFIGTEHQAALVGSVLEYPSGYNGIENIQLSIEESIEYLQRCIYYIDQVIEGDIILVGGQSWLIPFDIEQQTAIYNLAFLESTRPDYAILVINPELDNEKYIIDTKVVLESLYKCDVVGIFYSDMRPYSSLSSKIKIKRSKADILKLNQELCEKFGLFAGCINNSDDIQCLVRNLETKLK